MISSWSTCHKILHILMFITSFEEQNITYRSCSNLRIHLCLAPHILRTVLEWIEQHLHLSISIADLAHQANLSEYHFAHMFKQSTGQSPHQYVLHTRLKKAHELILNSHLELIEIALSCGFSSASHFSTRFKQHFGYIPSQLRK
ncbi:helix-turn-helix domain-containing protein [Acinetobacter wuhouensis]|uniref:Helix-turn-helix domain-containing protein n=1 Tax=Acinetobacter wuhouensis TaxID=1879050 RepID=A0A3G2T6P9_9GAMM|nr:helix-turn-helix domain-containing protein [Acinetobacter wuhouensis]